MHENNGLDKYFVSKFTYNGKSNFHIQAWKLICSIIYICVSLSIAQRPRIIVFAPFLPLLACHWLQSCKGQGITVFICIIFPLYFIINQLYYVTSRKWFDLWRGNLVGIYTYRCFDFQWMLHFRFHLNAACCIYNWCF